MEWVILAIAIGLVGQWIYTRDYCHDEKSDRTANWGNIPREGINYHLSKVRDWNP